MKYKNQILAFFVGLFVVPLLLLGVGIFHQKQKVVEQDIVKSVHESSRLTQEQFLQMTDFEKGEYFFNVQEDPEGEYNIVKAQNYYLKAVAENPKIHPFAWHQLARTYFITGNYIDAIRKAEKQIEYFGNEVPNVYYVLGLTYAYKAQKSNDVGDWEEAEKAFLKYIEFDPESPWAKVDLSWVYFSQGKYELMEPILETALTDAPNNPWVLNMYGLALLNTTKNKTEALIYFQKAQVEAEKLTLQDWGRSYSGNNPQDWAEGITDFKNAIAKNIALAGG